MRVGVIRGDLSGPVFIADMEQSSQPHLPFTKGQTRYVGRPDLTRVGTVLAAVQAGLLATSAPTLSVVIGSGNHTLRFGINGASIVASQIAQATYATLATLLVAINAGLVTAGLDVVAVADYAAPTKILFHTVAAVGPGTVLLLDTNGNGSTANASLGFGAGGGTCTVSTAATTITSLLPVGGPLDVRATTIRSQDTAGLRGITDAQVTALADQIAPKFAETVTSRASFTAGNLHGLLSASFTPDSTRVPAIVTGAAVTVTTDDGNTIFT